MSTTHTTPNDPWPTEIKSLEEGKILQVSFDTGDHFEFTAELLRVESPSAEVQGHSSEEKKTIAGKRNVRIKKIEPAGNYAVLLRFDDGHDTGLFSWEYLYDLGTRRDEVWQAYLAALKDQGLSRD